MLDKYPKGVYTSDMQKSKQKLINRLKIIEGQIRGLQNMIEKDIYCIDVITQTSAVKQALSSIEDVLMENHLGTCLVHQIKKGETSKATKEMLKVYQLKRK
jgi:DNA-binding FrmR family transcriptional regulator